MTGGRGVPAWPLLAALCWLLPVRAGAGDTFEGGGLPGLRETVGQAKTFRPGHGRGARRIPGDIRDVEGAPVDGGLTQAEGHGEGQARRQDLKLETVEGRVFAWDSSNKRREEASGGGGSGAQNLAGKVVVICFYMPLMYGPNSQAKIALDNLEQLRSDPRYQKDLKAFAVAIKSDAAGILKREDVDGDGRREHQALEFAPDQDSSKYAAFRPVSNSALFFTIFDRSGGVVRTVDGNDIDTLKRVVSGQFPQ